MSRFLPHVTRATSTTSTTRAVRTTAAVLAACSLALTGCSGDGEDAESTTGPQEASLVGAGEMLGDTFDLQAHRGGRGEWTENSSGAFSEALMAGVTTLELDVVVSADGVPVVWHDPEIDPEKCEDTQPVTEGDEQFPYVGKLVHELTYEQLQTLNCNKQLEDFPDAEHPHANSLIRLEDVFDVAAGEPEVHFNIETKIEAEEPEKSASPQEFVDAIVPVLQERDVVDRATVQSFDWRSLPLVHEAEPKLMTVVLWDDTTWKPDSVWTGDVDYDAVDGDITQAAAQLNAGVLSPDYELVDEDLIARAHASGLPVIPWTVNEASDMQKMIDLGVDGIITDYPTRLKGILDERGITYLPGEARQ